MTYFPFIISCIPHQEGRAGTVTPILVGPHHVSASLVLFQEGKSSTDSAEIQSGGTVTEQESLQL